MYGWRRRLWDCVACRLDCVPCLTTARSIKLSYVQMIIPVGAALLIWMGGVSPAWIILAAIAGGLVYGLNKKG